MHVRRAIVQQQDSDYQTQTELPKGPPFWWGYPFLFSLVSICMPMLRITTFLQFWCLKLSIFALSFVDFSGSTINSGLYSEGANYSSDP